MRSVKSSWQGEAGRLVCRWAETKELQVPYDAPWIHDASQTAPHAEGVSPLAVALDFTRLSPLAGKGWFERALGGCTSQATDCSE